MNVDQPRVSRAHRRSVDHKYLYRQERESEREPLEDREYEQLATSNGEPTATIPITESKMARAENLKLRGINNSAELECRSYLRRRRKDEIDRPLAANLIRRLTGLEVAHCTSPWTAQKPLYFLYKNNNFISIFVNNRFFDLGLDLL